MINKKTNIIIAIVILITLIFPSCVKELNLSSKSSSEFSIHTDITSLHSGKDFIYTDKRLTVGLIGPGADSRLSLVSKNIREVSKEWNINIIFCDGQGKQAKQIEHFEDLIDKQVDIIGFIPVWESGWEDILKKVKQAKIPVILVDRLVECIDESLWTSCIVNDFYNEGYLAGQWLKDYLKKNKRTDKIINIAELSGPINEKFVNSIGIGFRDAIGDDEFLNITVSDTGDCVEEKAKEIMESYLEEKQDINVLLCHNYDMAQGAINSIETFGIRPGEDIIILVTNIDGTNAALEAVVDGKIACSVERNSLMGDLFMEACVRLANGEEIEREIHPVDRVFDITNAQAEIDYRKLKGYGY